MALWGSFTTSAYSNRSLTFSWSATQSIGGNYSTISWSLVGSGSQSQYYKAAPFKVVIDGEQVYYSSTRINLSNGTLVASGTKTIYHNTSGSRSFSASVEAAIYSMAINVSGSGSWSLDNIPRAAAISTAPNFTDEDNATITYSNPAGTAVTSLKACISWTGGADIAYRDIDKNSTSYTFNFTDAEREALRNSTINSNSRNVVFYVTTEIGGNTYYSTLTKTLTIVNATPTFTSSVKDTGAASIALTGSTAGNVSMIKGFNYMECSMIATAYKGASIARYRITNGANAVEAAAAQFNNAESNSFLFEVWDSRGNHNSYTTTIPMIDYIPLTCNVDGKIALSTSDSTKASVTFTAQGNFYKGSFGAKDNSLFVEYTLLDAEGNTVNKDGVDITEQADNGTYNISFTIDDLDYRNSYIVRVDAADAIKNVFTNSKTLKAIPIFDWGENDFNFNVPIAFNNIPMMDFVEEQGEQDGWFYRKWNSGIAECWKIYYENNVNMGATNFNGFWYSGTIDVPFPFTFTNLPVVTVDGGSTSNMNFVRVFGNYQDAASFTVVGLVNTTTNITVTIRAIGKWK